MKGKFVYFIKPVGIAGPIKIGCSEYVDVRLACLAAWSPLPLEIVVTIPGSFDLERNIHECLARSYSHKEWFHATDEVTGLVGKLLAGVPIEEALDLSARHPRAWRSFRHEPRGKNSLYRVHLTRVRQARARSKGIDGAVHLPTASVWKALESLKWQRDTDRTDLSVIDSYVANPVAHGQRDTNKLLLDPPPRLSRAQVQARNATVQSRYLAGETGQAIAESLGISRARVFQILEKAGVRARSQVAHRPAPLVQHEAAE